ncbi:MAG: Gfo/Idh/MocA family oxidoreductase [Rhodospirillales bacterium]
MNKSVLQVAIIGCGRVSGHHCRAIRLVDGVELVAVCDIVEEKSKIYASEFNVPFFSNYHEMLRDIPNIDIVAIITPSGMHFEHGMDIIRRYKKHIIIEKPTFMRPQQLVLAYDEADRNNVQIFPVFQNRYNKAVQRIKLSLNNGELGDIRIISVRVRWCRPQRYYDLSPWRGTYSHDGGALTNQGIHHVDLLRYLGGEVMKINATMRTLGADIEVEDTAVATMSYKNGAVGVLEVTTAARPDDFEASLSIVGSKGLAQLGGIAVNELQIFTPDPQACGQHSEEFLGLNGEGAVYGYGHFAMYRDIVAGFTGDDPYPVSRNDCLSSLKLLHAFYRSDELNDWVDVESNQESCRLGKENDPISNLYRTPSP